MALISFVHTCECVYRDLQQKLDAFQLHSLYQFVTKFARLSLGGAKKKMGGRTTRSLTSASWNLIKKYAASNVTEVEMGKIKKIGREFLLEQLPTGEEPQMQFNFNQIAEQLTSKMHSEPHREA